VDFLRLVETCEKVAKNTKKSKKIEILSHFLKTLEESEIPVAVLFITGSIFPEAESKSLDVGWKTIEKVGRDHQKTLLTTPLSILDIGDYFKKISSQRGEGSRKKKENLLQSLISRASPLERKYIFKSIFGEMRIGVSEGTMLEAISKASYLNLDLLRKALMFLGDLGEVARIALVEGKKGLEKINITLFIPIKPMLAEMANSLEEALQEHRKCALEFKYDGARIQIHKKGEKVVIFSRRLTNVTESLPEIVELSKSIKTKEVIAEGEIIAIDKSGRPFPFQYLMKRFKRVHDIERLKKSIPLKLYLFDILFVDGMSLVDETYEKRWKLLEEICPKDLLASRIITKDLKEARAFMGESIKSGHEGLMIKDLDSKYIPGKRGKKWLKVKTSVTLDAVIIAAEWGHGRRKEWLSNYHLAVRDEETGEFMMIGKTFKGLNDKEFQWMTQELLKLKIAESEFIITVKPKIIVEVAFSEIQRSPHYSSGFALRFARITRIREDLSIEDVDTLERVRNLYENQFKYKAKFL